MEAFGFSLELLIIDSRQIVKILYSILSFLILIFALFNNICSIITFKHQSFQQSTIGSILFILSVINTTPLLIFFIKFLQITLKIADIHSCKLLSYLLPVFTRSTFWMISWLTISRLVIILSPMSIFLKRNFPARIMATSTLLLLFSLHIHEIVYYTSIQHVPTNIPICVPNYQHSGILIFHRLNTLIHYLVPFSIQVVSVTFLVILVARSRDRTMAKRKAFRQILSEQFHKHKEQYLVPIIIFVSSSPQIILTFHFACTELSSTMRHCLVLASLLSYMPQTLGFILFILPSSVYRSEFRKTLVGARLFHMIGRKEKQTNAVAKQKT